MKNATEVTLRLSSNAVGDSNDENNFLHKLLSTNSQVSRFGQAFANGSSANINLSKTQFHKIGQLGGFLGLPLMNIVLKPLAKSILIPLSSGNNRCNYS